jgi:hypothetical protein
MYRFNINNFSDELKSVSDPRIVYDELLTYYLYLGCKPELYESTRKNKKYMVLDSKTNKYIHFGDRRYQDYSKHQDEERRLKFQSRNKHWLNGIKLLSPAYLSTILLW